jgi:hypothetical protein
VRVCSVCSSPCAGLILQPRGPTKYVQAQETEKQPRTNKSAIEPFMVMITIIIIIVLTAYGTKSHLHVYAKCLSMLFILLCVSD